MEKVFAMCSVFQWVCPHCVSIQTAVAGQFYAKTQVFKCTFDGCGKYTEVVRPSLLVQSSEVQHG